jgi:hypothetical protein
VGTTFRPGQLSVKKMPAGAFLFIAHDPLIDSHGALGAATQDYEDAIAFC